MKKIKRILSAILVAVTVICAATVVGAANVSFTDVSGHWAWTNGQIPYLVEKGVLNGYKQTNGTYMFKPDAAVTRAEFIKMLDETFGLTEEKSVKYKDVDLSDWFYVYYARAEAQGYLINYGTYAYPDNEITREEATALLVRYLDLPVTDKASASTFSDYMSISEYYRDYVLRAVYAGIINGYSENGKFSFKPQNTLTRAEALTILYRAAGCIFNSNSYSRDGGAADKNSVITDGGIVIKNVTLNGRNIITEGASNGKITFSNCDINDTLYIRGSSEITFDNCEIENIVANGGGKIILSSGTKVESLDAEVQTDISAYYGNTIDTLNIKENAEYSTFSGSGIISNAFINAKGFSSSTLPEKFEIGSGLTATFDSVQYTGTSEAENIFLITPFLTSDNVNSFLNLIPNESGTVYYYYTNLDAVPSANDFESYHVNTNYSGAFSVEKGEPAFEKTFSESAISGYSYVVIQLQSGNQKYAPVIITNSTAVGTGFKVEPYLDSEQEYTIKLQSKFGGKLYWYYSDSGNNLSQIEFISQYEETESALRGESLISSSKAVSCTLTEKYVKNYDYVALMFQSASGTYYNPVLVAVGDNGFKEAPEIKSVGIITCTPSVTGNLYYYYSESPTLPTPSKFFTEYKKAEYAKKVEITKRQETDISYNTDYVDVYPYMIFSIRNSSGDFLAPIALEIDYTTGFKKNPEVVDAETISMKTEEDGVVRYYYSTSDKAPSSEEFNEIYSGMKKNYFGEVDAYDNRTTQIKYKSSIAANYNYMVIMLTDEDNKDYCPVVLALDIATKTGFKTEPYVNGNKVYFKTESSGEVWYYFTAIGDPVSVSEFEEEWSESSSAISGSMEVSEKVSSYFDIVSKNDIKKYSIKYVVVAFYNTVKEEFGFPVIIPIAENIEIQYSGLDDVELIGNYVHATADYSGKLYYFMTDDVANISASTFSYVYNSVNDNDIKDRMDIDAGETKRIEYNKNYKYIVMSLRIYNVDTDEYEYLKPVFVNVENGDASNSNVTINSYGFDFDEYDLSMAPRKYKLKITPEFDGNVHVYLEYNNFKTKATSTPVQKGVEVTIDFSSYVEMISNLNVNVSNIIAHLQLEVDDDNIHKALKIPVID